MDNVNNSAGQTQLELYEWESCKGISLYMALYVGISVDMIANIDDNIVEVHEDS